MPSSYQPRLPRASPLRQLVHHGWDEFLADYESKCRPTLGPINPAVATTVESFLHCGDLASGFTRLQCPDCGHEKFLAFTCKTRHFCPSCQQRRGRTTSDWSATAVCHPVPHRQFFFTIPKILRGIFRKRRHLLTTSSPPPPIPSASPLAPALTFPTVKLEPSPPSTPSATTSSCTLTSTSSPPPPFDIENLEPIEPPWLATKE